MFSFIPINAENEAIMRNAGMEPWEEALPTDELWKEWVYVR